MAVLQLLVIGCLAAGVMGHGYLRQPPSRSSAWRKGFSTPITYQDNELNCGGYGRQWDVNGGKCGICGDPWDGPRPNEAGGKFATGTITASYTQGQVVGVEVKITVHHRGWFEFRLCPNNDVNSRATQECLDRYLLPLADGSGTRFPLPADIHVKDFKLNLRLPEGLTCTQCVLQWRYNTGNSWGTDPVTRVSGMGQGAQEQFYGCADVSIGGSGGVTPSASPTPSTSRQQTVVPTPSSSSTTRNPETPSSSSTTRNPETTEICEASGAFANVSGMNTWCARNCKTGYCPGTHCKCRPAL